MSFSYNKPWETTETQANSTAPQPIAQMATPVPLDFSTAPSVQMPSIDSPAAERYAQVEQAVAQQFAAVPQYAPTPVLQHPTNEAAQPIPAAWAQPTPQPVFEQPQIAPVQMIAFPTEPVAVQQPVYHEPVYQAPQAAYTHPVEPVYQQPVYAEPTPVYQEPVPQYHAEPQQAAYVVQPVYHHTPQEYTAAPVQETFHQVAPEVSYAPIAAAPVVQQAAPEAFVPVHSTESQANEANGKVIEMPRRPNVNISPSPAMPSLGVLDVLLADDSVSDILVNGRENIFIDRGGKMVDSGIRFRSQEDLCDIAARIMETIGQYWTDDRPIIDTRLPDGSRVNMVGPPIAIDGVSISIRKFPKNKITLDSMAESGKIPLQLAEFLKGCVRHRVNVLIAGSTSSGKTTLLSALASAANIDERIVTIEDSAEIKLSLPNIVRMESSPSRVTTPGEKPGEPVSMRDLVKNALRMRPDRIILGESRGAEAFDVLQAMNTGHDGSMTTLHANAPRDALGRLETMVMTAMPQLSLKIIRQQIASAVNLLIQTTRNKEGLRYISHITEVCGIEGETVVLQDLVTYKEGPNGTQGEYKWGVGAPRNALVADAARSSGIMKITQ